MPHYITAVIVVIDAFGSLQLIILYLQNK